MTVEAAGDVSEGEGAQTGLVAVVGVDTEGIIVHVSPGITDLLGWAEDELPGRPLRVLVPDRFHEPHTAGFSRFAETGQLGLVGRSLALPALTATGDERDIELVLSIPSRSDPAAVVGVLRPRARYESEAADRRRVELALSARGMGVWTHRPATGEVIWDEQMERLHGFEPGTFSGRYDNHDDHIHPDDQKVIRAQVEEAMRTGDRFDFRCRVRRCDDEEAWLEGSGVPIVDSAGELVELTGICYDITEDVRARDELEERVRHGALAGAVGRAFVSHEDLDEKLQRTAEAIVEHLRAAFARVWVLPDNSDVLELRASAGLYTHLDGDHSRVRVGDLKIGRIADTAEPHLTNNVADDPLVDTDWARQTGMESFAGYPLVVGDRRVGVLALFAQHRLEKSTLRALGAIADTVAIGIEQARTANEVLELYDQTRRHAAAVEEALLERARVAELLQQSLLPPSLPEIDGFELEGRYRSGVEEVGGDFYDVFPLSGTRWGFMVGDICGRGPEAARFTALARHSLRTALMLGHEPAAALAALNAALLRSNNDGRFCTAVCGIIVADEDQSTVRLGVAGHPPPLHAHADGSVTRIAGTGTLLGVFSEATFGQTSIELQPEDGLVLYTDGVTEARRGSDMFGVDGLEDLLSETGQREAKVIVDAIVEAVAGYDDAAADDDLAIVVIKRL